MSDTTTSRKRGLFGRMFGRDKPSETAAEEPVGEKVGVPVLQPVPTPDDQLEVLGPELSGPEALGEAEAEIPSPEVGANDPLAEETTVDPTTAMPPAPAQALTALGPGDADVIDYDVPATDRAASAAGSAPRLGWLQRLRFGLSRTSLRLGDGITGLFTKRRLDVETLDDLEDLLLQADLGVATARRIRDKLSHERLDKAITADEVRAVLASEVAAVLAKVAQPLPQPGLARPHVILIVGVNGTGKTTTIGKLAHLYRQQGKTVMLAAGDTFRAAAVEQLKIWGERTNSPVVARKIGSDASGLAFDALKSAQEQNIDILLIDTAGRLQNKSVLMEELEKVVRVIRKLDPDAPHDTVLVLDATTGQNALNQVDVFKERAGVTGLVMTKLDGTARGGILVAIAERFALPVYAIGIGEGIDDLQPFDATEFAQAIAQS